MIEFIRSRPTELWLALWTAVVGVLEATGVELGAPLVAAVAALIGALITFLAHRAEGWGA